MKLCQSFSNWDYFKHLIHYLATNVKDLNELNYCSEENELILY